MVDCDVNMTPEGQFDARGSPAAACEIIDD